MKDTADFTLAELKRGYTLDPEDSSYRCLFCGERYARGIIYPAGEQLMDARMAIQTHVARAHGSAFHALLKLGKKATGMTDAQADMMRMFYERIPDKEIAAQTGIAASTVRYQRHALREKARQAKVFLALSQIMEESQNRPQRDPDALLDIHPGATMVDDRYLITEKEAATILRTCFYSLDPLKLKSFPPKQKKKLVILRAIADQFDPDTRYAGRDVDETLGAIYEDYASLRRYLIEYGFMARTPDGKEYWRISNATGGVLDD